MHKTQRKTTITLKKIERHLAYIDNKLNEYNEALQNADEDLSAGQAGNKIIIENQIEKHNGRKAFYNNLTEQSEQTGEVQVSVSDPESRQLISCNNITEVGYNGIRNLFSPHWNSYD